MEPASSPHQSPASPTSVPLLDLDAEDVYEVTRYSRCTAIVHSTTFEASLVITYDNEEGIYYCQPYMLPSAEMPPDFETPLPHSDYHILGHGCRLQIFRKLALNQATGQFELKPGLRADVLQHCHDLSQPLYSQQIPYHTVVVDTSSFQAYTVEECDVTVENYYAIRSLVMSDSRDNLAKFWLHLPDPTNHYCLLGVDSPFIRDMLRVDPSIVRYVLRDEFRVRVRAPSERGPPMRYPDEENPNDNEDQSMNDPDREDLNDEELPMHDPNHPRLPSFEDDNHGADLNHAHIPRTVADIPDHIAYSKPDTENTGLHTSGFMPMEMTVKYSDCGQFRGDQCVMCGAFHFLKERLLADKDQPLKHVAYTLCCQQGRIMRPATAPCPPLFRQLLTFQGMTTAQINEFKSCIRRINVHFAFASLTSTKEAKLPGKGPYVYKVEGQMVRRVSTAQARTGQLPKFSQIYFHDPADAESALLQHPIMEKFTPWLKNKFLELYTYIRENNPYARSYQMLRDVATSIERTGQPVPEMTLVFNNRKSSAHRTYNASNPLADSEVSMVIHGSLPDVERRRAVAVCLKDRADNVDSWVYLKATSPEVDSLTYPLLWPHGVEGWCPGDTAWHSSIERFYPPPRVLSRRGALAAAARARSSLQFIDEEAIDEDEPPPPETEQDEHASPEGNRNKKRNKNLRSYSLMNYYAWNTHFRPPTEHTFSAQHYGGRLFQQYCVDAFSKVEEKRLDDLRDPRMQHQLRATSYEKLKKHLEYRAHRAGENIQAGKPIVLPSSFIGGPRYMVGKYQDAMTISRNTASPDLFVTATVNPQWKEILEALEPGQTTADRPDIVCRVFKLKLDELLKDLIEEEIFGEVAGYAWTIEYQVKGLPHVHILLILKNQVDKARMAEHIDRIICAEIPDRRTNPKLYQAVKSHMIHGPCGDANPKCPCMNHPECPGRCFRKFPMREAKETLSDVDGYPEYRRRMTGQNAHTIPELGLHRDVHNGWVVPYNPYLLLKYDTHINVEISTSIKSFKYIFKYIMKGGEKVEVRLRTVVDSEEGTNTYLDLDELKTWADARYMSSHEALWRIFDFPTNALSHVVHRLSIHLPNEQTVVFTEENAESIAQAPPKHSTLTAYFALCEGDGYDQEVRDLARITKYHDIPQFFTWKTTGDCFWAPRANKAPSKPVMYWNSHKPVIGRMYDVSPKNLELYALRRLLIHRVGAESFKDLLFIWDNTFDEDGQRNGYHCDSFHMAAKVLGLIVNEREWHLCLEEANQFSMPWQMRRLFATILMNCDVTDPQLLWDETCDWLISTPHHSSERLSSSGNGVSATRNDLLFTAYTRIEKYIQKNNPHMSMAETFHIRPPVPDEQEPQLGQDDLPPNLVTLAEEADQLADMLNPEQRTVYDAIVHSILNQEGKSFFIDGPGGSGKSFLYKCIMLRLSSLSRTFSACASTGIAATVIGACTAYKLLGCPTELEFDSVSMLHMDTKAAAHLRQTSCIIWDEAPASHRFVLELCNRLLQDVCMNTLTFGGKTMVLGGDWRQTLPVVTRGTNAQQVAACLRMSNLWPLFEANTYVLTGNMRASNPVFAEWLLDIGNGISGSIINFAENNIRVVASTRALIQATFGLVLNDSTLPALARTAILSPTNKNTFLFNEEVLSLIDSPSVFQFSVDYPIVERERNPMVIPEEFLHTLTPAGMPPHRLHLKKGAIYMLLRNMNVADGLCNGTRFFLEGFTPNALYCLMIQHDKTLPPKRFRLPRITSTPQKHYPFPFKRRQFPVRPAFAMTVNKGQGCTLDAAGLDASVPVFGHGQLYVAFSRVSDFDKITILIPNGEPTSRNIVFQEVFDKEYIDTQIRIRSERPPCSERFQSNYSRMPDDHLNPFMDEDTEALIDQMDHLDEYNPNDGVHDPTTDLPYTRDELVFEEDWVPDDSWQE